MLLLRVASFLRLSAASKSIQSNFHCSFWPLLCSSNCRQAKTVKQKWKIEENKLTNFHGLEKKQYLCSNTTDDMAMETASKLAEPGTIAAVDEQQQEAGEKTLVKKFMRSVAAGGKLRNISIELDQGRSGVKFLLIYKKLVNGRVIHSPKFLVPEEAYPLIRAMDELLMELATKEIVKMSISSSGRHVLFSTSSPGRVYDFKLDLEWEDGRFFVKLSTRRNEAKPEHKERTFWLYLKEFHRIRHEMGAMLTEFDGSQPVDEPPKLSDWLLMDGRPRRPVRQQMPVQTYQNGRQQQQMPRMEMAQERREQSKQRPDEHFVKQFSTRDMDKNAMARGENASDGHKLLSKINLRSLGVEGGPEKLTVRLEQGRGGHKFLHIHKLINENFKSFPNIMVPEDTYPFVRAMDELLEELVTRAGRKLPSTVNRLLFSTRSPGIFYDFKLNLIWTNGHFIVNLGSRKTDRSPEHVERRLLLSMKQFYWFRHRMGEMLAEFDGSQQLDLPPKLPFWLSMADDRPIPRSGQYPPTKQQQLAKMRPVFAGFTGNNNRRKQRWNYGREQIYVIEREDQRRKKEEKEDNQTHHPRLQSNDIWDDLSWMR